LTETLPLNSYCRQTLRHGKLQHALAGSLLGSSGTRLASHRPRWYFEVGCGSSGRTRPSHMGGLELWANHHESRPISLTSLLVPLVNVMSSPQVPSEHKGDAPRKLGPLIRCQYHPLSSLRPSLPHFSPHSYHEIVLSSSLTDLLSIRTRLQANSRDGKLQNAVTG